jgi:hypothetical protein
MLLLVLLFSPKYWTMRAKVAFVFYHLLGTSPGLSEVGSVCPTIDATPTPPAPPKTIYFRKRKIMIAAYIYTHTHTHTHTHGT